jgi:hypothetical protein
VPVPPRENNCFAHYHMTIDEYGLWTHAREVSHESKVFYFDGRKIAARFAGTGKDRPYRIGKRLVRKGWFSVLRTPKRLKNGMFAPGEYYPLSHDEWINKNGTDFCFACPQTATGGDVTSPQIANDQSSNCERPVAKRGHNLKGLNLNKNKNENSVRSQTSTTHGQGETLLAQLAILGDDPLATFDDLQGRAVIKLLEDHTAEEIKAAFREVWDSAADEFGRKHFARTFSSKAPQIIAIHRSRRKEALKTQENIRLAIEREQGTAAAEIAARLAEDAAEQDLVEATLPDEL